MAERLTRELRTPYVLGERPAHGHGHASASPAPADDDDAAADVVRNADVAMYMAKANGKAGFAVFDPGMHAAIRERHELGVQLQSAVELGQLLAGLPAHRRPGRTAAWPASRRSSAGSTRSAAWSRPGEFIEIAEENGVDPADRPLGPARGLPRGGVLVDHRPVRLPVRQRLGARDPAAGLRRRRPRGPRRRRDGRRAAQPRDHRDGAAQGDAVDDRDARGPAPSSASGSSSTTSGPATSRSATCASSRSTSSRSPASSSRSPTATRGPRPWPAPSWRWARSLDIVTVAEGIETAEQAARMRDLGCAYGQGYYFAQPIARASGRRRRLRLRWACGRRAARTRPTPSRPRVRAGPRSRRSARRPVAGSARVGRRLGLDRGSPGRPRPPRLQAARGRAPAARPATRAAGSALRRLRRRDRRSWRRPAGGSHDRGGSGATVPAQRPGRA